MEGEYEELAEKLASLCIRELDSDQDAEDTINKVVRATNCILKEKSRELPPQRVLLNTCYGGFGFSDAFEQFRESLPEGRSKTRDDGDVCDEVFLFGKHLASEMPFVYETILYQEAFDIKGIVAGIHGINRKETTERDATTQCEAHAIAKRAVENFISQSHNRLQRTDKKVPEFLRAIEIYGQVDSMAWLQCSNGYLDQSITFGRDAVAVLHDQDARSELDTAYSLLTAKEDVGDKETRAYMRLGLLGASGEYCQLNVQHVPALCAYRIHEYDGLQTVLIM